jgi:NAD(P)-dependent dehydrogenase (short-subunit alcohol dehydrogenase family)
MEGKVVVITGASSGIGRATAVELARRGARVLLVGRTPERCQAALAAVRDVGRADCDVIQGDLATLAGTRAVAEQVLAGTDRLDVLVNNAAVVLVRRTTTPDGYEATFALNYLSCFLLTGLLLPLLRKSAPARIVNVASEGHRYFRLDLDDLQNERRYSTMRVYGRSKTAGILWNVELARRLQGSGITANCLHPGTIRSNLGQGNGPALDVLQRILTRFMKTPEQGTATSVYLATSPDVEGVSGCYFVNCRQKKPARHAVDPVTARRLWKISEGLVGYRYLETGSAP